MLTNESSIDIIGNGILIDSLSIDGLKKAIKKSQKLSNLKMRELSFKNAKIINANHSLENYKKLMKIYLKEIIKKP